jgi:DNA-binding transcriptional LysR family regulator
MDTRYLESFIAVVEDGSIADASRRLSLTPGAVTKRLKALEREFGMRLVVRSGRTVRPTHAGVIILEQARSLVRDAISIHEFLIGKMHRLSFRIGAIPSAVAGLLPDLLARLASERPDVEVTLKCENLAKLSELIAEQRLDAAIMIRPPRGLSKGYEWVPLRKPSLQVLTAAAAASSDAAFLLKSRPLIRYRSDDCTELVNLYLRHTGLRPRIMTELDSFDAVERLVVADLGVSLVPEWVVSSTQGTARVPIVCPEDLGELGLLWVRGSALTPIVRIVLEGLTLKLAHSNHIEQGVPTDLAIDSGTARLLRFPKKNR